MSQPFETLFVVLGLFLFVARLNRRRAKWQTLILFFHNISEKRPQNYLRSALLTWWMCGSVCVCPSCPRPLRSCSPFLKTDMMWSHIMSGCATPFCFEVMSMLNILCTWLNGCGYITLMIRPWTFPGSSAPPSALCLLSWHKFWTWGWADLRSKLEVPDSSNRSGRKFPVLSGCGFRGCSFSSYIPTWSIVVRCNAGWFFRSIKLSISHYISHMNLNQQIGMNLSLTVQAVILLLLLASIFTISIYSFWWCAAVCFTVAGVLRIRVWTMGWTLYWDLGLSGSWPNSKQNHRLVKAHRRHKGWNNRWEPQWI